MRTKRSSWRQWAITGLSGRSLTSGSCMLFWIKKTQTWLKSMVNRLWCLSRTWVPAVRCAGTPARARVTPVGCWTDARCLKETMIRSTLCSSVAQFLAKGCGKLPCATGNVAVAEGEFSIMLKGEKKVPCLYSLCVKMSPFIPGDKETSRGRAVGFTGQVRAPPPPPVCSWADWWRGSSPPARLLALVVGLVPSAPCFQRLPRPILTAACAGERAVSPSPHRAPLLLCWSRTIGGVLCTGQKSGVWFHFLHTPARTQYVFLLLVLVARAVCIRHSSERARCGGIGSWWRHLCGACLNCQVAARGPGGLHSLA